MSAYEQLRAALITRRKELKLSQQKVAEAMGTQQSALSELETGVTKDPCMGTLAKWAFALDLELIVDAREKGAA